MNAEIGTAHTVPLRRPAFQVNVVKYLQPPAGGAPALRVAINPDGTDITRGIFDLDISITHPFPGSNLRGFDVRGIVLGAKGTQLSQFDSGVQYPKPTEMRLLNADGYTRWWNAVEFLTPGLFGYTPGMFGFGSPKATVNGFKYFADCLEPSDPLEIDPATRGTFSTLDANSDPNTLTRQYILQFPMVGGDPVVRFQYAVCASFSPPEPGNPPPAPVDAYPIEANCPEAYNISIAVDPSSTAFYTSVQAGGDLVLNIEIFDWQSTENPDGLPGEIGAVRLESPTLWTGLIDPIAAGPPMATNNPTSSVWQVEISDITPHLKRQEILVTVQQAGRLRYEPPIEGPIYPGDAILSAYQLFVFELPDNSAPDIGEISGSDMYAPGAQLVFVLSSMYDLQDGPNLTVTWDFDGDGGDGIFNDDEDGSNTNMKGSFTFAGPGTYSVQCRVTDTQGVYTNSNVLGVSEISLPYADPMDASTRTRWRVENGLFDIHAPELEWNLQDDHWRGWSTSSPFSGNYEDDMNTMLISPQLPPGELVIPGSRLSVIVSHRYLTESVYDGCRVYYRLNGNDGGVWAELSPLYDGLSLDYPQYLDDLYCISGVGFGDLIEFGFLFDSDSLHHTYPGWDITHLVLTDNEPPVIEGIYGPQDVDNFGPATYSTIATDLDGIASYMWSVEPRSAGAPPAYDDPGDGAGNIDVTFPADGNYDIFVEVTDAPDPPSPPLWSVFGPHTVTVFEIHPDPFFSDDFDIDTGAWSYTGGVADGSYQDFWHIDTAQSFLSNLGPDGCFAEYDTPPIPKSAYALDQVTFPDSPVETHFKMRHRLWTEPGDGGGVDQPYDGQWVEIDGDIIEPSFGFLYDDNGGLWPHGYFVGVTGGADDWAGWVGSTFVLGTDYNDGLSHTLTFHQYSSSTGSNCAPLEGWQIDYIEFFLND